ncbi:MAG: sugar phosphate isomerase/epimerase [Oryzomonas sp.]|uniref:sugar phosphate isomerase/epimerase family protein n=1 Tax=Oryzomonas sp. TaxID=2855186 RepID=UPI00283EBFD7|nr:sugar phosphate isomerase/epimerase [Oryzomonas sp.]MDR3581249.1 sugar phosphate isomerase/epimerase [Oryzomonas sp.]
MLSIGSNINEVRVDGSLRALRRDLSAFLDFGLTAAEISVHGLDAVKNGRLDRKRTSEVKAMLADFPFSYSVHAPNPLNLMDRVNSALHRDVLMASLEFSAEIGAEVMVYHPGRYLVEEEFGVRGTLSLEPDEQERLLDEEARILQEAAGAFPGIVIAMENARPYLHHSPYCYAERPSELKAQVERIDRKNVRINLDFGHLRMSSRFYGLDPVDEVRAIAPLIAHCHVHDNFGNPVYHTEKTQTHQIPFGKGDSHMPVGWGDIPFSRIFAEFIGSYNGLLICELRSRYFEHTREAAGNLADVLKELGHAAQIAELTVSQKACEW